MRRARVPLDNGLALAQAGPSMMAQGSDSSGLKAAIFPFPGAAVPTIDQLTARMTHGDEEAFQMFHDLYCDRLFRYLIVLCRSDEELSRDLLQTVLLKVVRSIRDFDDEVAFWNWLAAIARNSFLDAVRRLHRRPTPEPISEISHLPADAQEPSSEPLLATALENALAQLPAEERALVESFYFEGGTYGSLAVRQDTSPKAVESRLARIRQKLRHAILKYLRYENS
jgi:RNA polymerase sigma factor (sigma-70 family)